jgi:benzoate/toluate 1,2-dioxygenase reductase subunit
VGFRAALHFDDGMQREIDVPQGQTLLDAALAAGLNLAHQCRSGSCASCICTLVSGEAGNVPGRASALLRSEIDAGMRLACSLLPQADIAVRFAYGSRLAEGEAAIRCDAVVSGLRQLSSDVWELSIQPEKRLDAVPGQYLRIQVPGTGSWRSYSISSEPDSPERLSLVVKIHPQGSMGRYLLERAGLGDACCVEGPFGAFTLGSWQGPHVFIAGGTGLGPILPMIDQLRERPGRTPDTILAFACSREEGLFHLDELSLRQDWMARLDVRVGVSRPSPAWHGPVGNPLALLEDAAFKPDSIVYVCGAPGLIEATRERCSSLGIPPERIRAEQYLPAPDTA